MSDLSQTNTLLRENKNNSFSYIKEKFLEGKLRGGNGKVFTEENFILLREYVKMLEEIFPSKWNLEMQFVDEDLLLFTGFSLHFSEIVVKNSRKQKHLIKDLYVIIRMKLESADKFKIYNRVRGFRSTVSEEENNANYFHSHLQRNNIRGLRDSTTSNNISNYHEFCEGAGPINSSRDAFNTNNSIDNFVGYLMQVVRLVSWESLEGGPHILIDNVLQTRNGTNQNLNSYNSFDNQEKDVERNALNSSSELHLVIKTLLKNYCIINPTFYAKFQEYTLENGLTEFTIQNENEIFKALIESYKDLASKVSTADDRILVDTGLSTGSSGIQFHKFSSLFQHLNEETDNLEGIVTRLLFLPEETLTTDDSYVENPQLISDKTLTIFRGEDIKGYKINTPTENRTRLKRLNLNSCKNLEVRDFRKIEIIQHLKQKLVQHG